MSYMDKLEWELRDVRARLAWGSQEGKRLYQEFMQADHKFMISLKNRDTAARNVETRTRLVEFSAWGIGESELRLEKQILHAMQNKLESTRNDKTSMRLKLIAFARELQAEVAYAHQLESAINIEVEESGNNCLLCDSSHHHHLTWPYLAKARAAASILVAEEIAATNATNSIAAAAEQPSARPQLEREGNPAWKADTEGGTENRPGLAAPHWKAIAALSGAHGARNPIAPRDLHPASRRQQQTGSVRCNLKGGEGPASTRPRVQSAVFLEVTQSQPTQQLLLLPVAAPALGAGVAAAPAGAVPAAALAAAAAPAAAAPVAAVTVVVAAPDGAVPALAARALAAPLVVAAPAVEVPSVALAGAATTVVVPAAAVAPAAVTLAAGAPAAVTSAAAIVRAVAEQCTSGVARGSPRPPPQAHAGYRRHRQRSQRARCVRSWPAG